MGFPPLSPWNPLCFLLRPLHLSSKSKHMCHLPSSHVIHLSPIRLGAGPSLCPLVPTVHSTQNSSLSSLLPGLSSQGRLGFNLDLSTWIQHKSDNQPNGFLNKWMHAWMNEGADEPQVAASLGEESRIMVSQLGSLLWVQECPEVLKFPVTLVLSPGQPPKKPEP